DQRGNADVLLLDMVQQALEGWAPVVTTADTLLHVDSGDWKTAFSAECAAGALLRFQAVALDLRFIGDPNVNGGGHRRSLQCSTRCMRAERYRLVGSLPHLYTQLAHDLTKGTSCRGVRAEGQAHHLRARTQLQGSVSAGLIPQRHWEVTRNLL